MKQTILFTYLSVALLSSSQATVTLTHHYKLGEAGSLSANGRALDSVGRADYTGFTGSGFNAMVGLSGSPGSTHYVSFTGKGKSKVNFGAENAASDLTNFAIDLWTRTSDTSEATTIFSSNRNRRGSLQIGMTSNGNWSSRYRNSSRNIWIGAALGVGQGAIANKWTRLTLISHGGTSTFYIDGVAQRGTSDFTPTWGRSELNIANRGRGSLDDLRIWDFDHTVDTSAAVGLAVFSPSSVPEPSSTALLCLGALAMIHRKRR